jgi:hypothetical protein
MILLISAASKLPEPGTREASAAYLRALRRFVSWATNGLNEAVLYHLIDEEFLASPGQDLLQAPQIHIAIRDMLAN